MAVLRKIETVEHVLTAIGSGMRLVVPHDGSEPFLMTQYVCNTPGIELPNPSPVPLEVAQQCVDRPEICQMRYEGEFYRTASGRTRKGMIRGGWKEFYSGKPADIFCMVQ